MLTGADSVFPLAASWRLASVLLHARLAEAGRPQALAAALRAAHGITIRPRPIAIVLSWSEVALDGIRVLMQAGGDDRAFRWSMK